MNVFLESWKPCKEHKIPVIPRENLLVKKYIRNVNSTQVPGAVFSHSLTPENEKVVNNCNSTIWYKPARCMSVGWELGKEFWEDIAEKDVFYPEQRYTD